MAVYSIIYKFGSMYLNLAGSGFAYAHRNVNLYSSTASNDQKWSIANLTGPTPIYSQNNAAYGLNYYRTNANCDIQIVSGNEEDAEVVFHKQDDGTYTIELAHHAGLFLTAVTDQLRGNVKWASETGDDSQRWEIRSASSIGPVKHTYSSGTYSGKSLSIIETDASNIKLVNLLQQVNLKQSPYYGINAAFFNMGADTSVLNVAICDGKAVGSARSDQLDGRLNNWLGSGVIFWNGSAFDFRPTTIGATYHDGSEFLNYGEGTWAQGGFSMYLGLSDWYNQMVAENWNNVPGIATTSAVRTGIVVNTVTKKVYLITCSTATTFSGFRDAIKARFGIINGTTLNSTYKGLFLDGDSSRLVGPMVWKLM